MTNIYMTGTDWGESFLAAVVLVGGLATEPPAMASSITVQADQPGHAVSPVLGGSSLKT